MCIVNIHCVAAVCNQTIIFSMCMYCYCIIMDLSAITMTHSLVCQLLHRFGLVQEVMEEALCDVLEESQTVDLHTGCV